MWQIKKLPFYIDLVFCLVLLPAMITLLPIERWLVNDSLFVYLLVSWLYIVYILNRRLTMPLLFIGNRRFLVALVLILLTLAGTYFITRYQMEIPFTGCILPVSVSRFPRSSFSSRQYGSCILWS